MKSIEGRHMQAAVTIRLYVREHVKQRKGDEMKEKLYWKLICKQKFINKRLLYVCA